MIRVEYDSRGVLDALQGFLARVADPAPAFAEIGERLQESTQARFNTSTAPDGSPWADNAEATILQYLAGRKGVYGKRGGLTQKGMTALLHKRPLVDSGVLRDTIHWQPIPGGVAVGTDRFAAAWTAGAAVHQFGSRDGRIPARPFLGISDEDRASILDILDAYLSN